ncbi:DUF4333 domain-containing protein [Aeromicrobium sp. CF4.19]|uniref:DUF4333 domain-containing protein n=1 Tax=Aeromicrobium sp. CF4.19 TaxID=3373082 RepID=UPI003EE7230D
MSARTKLTAVVVLLLGIGALLFGLRSCSADESGDPEPSPSASASPSESLAPVEMTTGVIEENIKERLDANAGQPTRIECPERVQQKIGTTFDCEVFFADQPDTEAVSTAKVEINGPDGAFTWNAEPNS